MSSFDPASLNRTFNPTWVTYRGDGYGRDQYIVFNNGGLNEQRMYTGVQSSKHDFKVSPHAHRRIQVTPHKEATAFDYTPDGSGRDLYIIRSYGLKNNYRSQYRHFEKTLRTGFETPLADQRIQNRRDPFKVDGTQFTNWPSKQARQLNAKIYQEQRRSIERLSKSPERTSGIFGRKSIDATDSTQKLNDLNPLNDPLNIGKILPGGYMGPVTAQSTPTNFFSQRNSIKDVKQGVSPNKNLSSTSTHSILAARRSSVPESDSRKQRSAIQNSRFCLAQTATNFGRLPKSALRNSTVRVNRRPLGIQTGAEKVVNTTLDSSKVENTTQINDQNQTASSPVQAAPTFTLSNKKRGVVQDSAAVQKMLKQAHQRVIGQRKDGERSKSVNGITTMLYEHQRKLLRADLKNLKQKNQANNFNLKNALKESFLNVNLDEAQKEKLVRATPDLPQGTPLLSNQKQKQAQSPASGANTALPGSRKKMMALTAGAGGSPWINTKAGESSRNRGSINNQQQQPPMTSNGFVQATTAESTLRDNQSQAGQKTPDLMSRRRTLNLQVNDFNNNENNEEDTHSQLMSESRVDRVLQTRKVPQTTSNLKKQSIFAKKSFSVSHGASQNQNNRPTTQHLSSQVEALRNQMNSQNGVVAVDQ